MDTVNYCFEPASEPTTSDSETPEAVDFARSQIAKRPELVVRLARLGERG